jgi:hypothetical protein
MAMHANRRFPNPPRAQRGITTLAITLILLIILTLMVLFSTNVGFFEQRTSTNENRAQITEQMAEYALNLGGEYLKVNRDNIISRTGAGWLTTTGTGTGWLRCPSGAIANTHPCAAERDATRRGQMYYFDNDRATGTIDPLPYSTLTGAQTGALTGADASTRFAGTVAVNALLCRIGYDMTNPAAPVPRCEAAPTNSNNVAVTLVTEARLTGESSTALMKETWATFSVPNPQAAVPLIASGIAEGLGNAQIVAAPNAGGYGVPASIWSPNDIDIGNSSGAACGSGGLGSVSTCHLGEYLQGTPRENLKTTCATSNNACGCPNVSASGVDFLSGHSQGTRREGLDILDRDSNCGPLPDITFFPREPYDKATDPTDDSLFEYIFNLDYVVAEGGTTVLSNCGTSGTQNCAAYALTEEFGATVLTDCSSLNTTSTGIFYVTGNCDLNSVGSPTSSVIIVVDGSLRLNGNIDVYGMIFARSNNNTQDVRGNGNVKIFGSLVVEGNVNTTGSIDIIYDSTAASQDPNRLPPGARFGKVTGSWLDSRVGI